MPYFGFQSPGFRIQEAKFSWIPEFRFSLIERFLSKGAQLSIGIFHVEKWENLEQKIDFMQKVEFDHPGERSPE